MAPAGFAGGSCGRESACQHTRRERRGFDPCVRKIPWRRKWQLTPELLPGKSRGQRSLAGCSPWGHRDSDTTGQLSPNSALQWKGKVTLLKWLRAFSITPLTLEGSRFSRDLFHLGWREICDYPAPSPCSPPPPPKGRKDAEKHLCGRHSGHSLTTRLGFWIKARLFPLPVPYTPSGPHHNNRGLL